MSSARNYLCAVASADSYPAALRLAEHAKQVVKMMGHIQQEFENDLSKDVRPFISPRVTRSSTNWAAPASTSQTLSQRGNPRDRWRDREMLPVCSTAASTWLSFPSRSRRDLNIIPLFEEELLVVRPSANKLAADISALCAPPT